MKRNKYLLFFALLAVFFFGVSGFAYALEVNYPQVPGLVAPSANCTGKDCLSIFVGYWFGLLVYIAGFLALISFAIGAVGLINPNIEAHKDAKDRMIGAILGLVLTLSSFLILRTINLSFITPSLTPLPGVQGVFYTNGSEQKPAPIENTDTSTVPTGFTNIQYVCSGDGPTLLVWFFPSTNFSPLEGANVQRVECNDQVAISGGSFQMAFETPGIYYCLGGCSGDMCEGYMSGVVTSSQDEIGAPFNGNIKGIRIVNGAGEPYYGAIFHKQAGLANGGECSDPLVNSGDGAVCKPVVAGVSSAVDIFTLNKNPKTSGNGVTLFSAPFGYNTGQEAGFFPILSKNIIFPYSFGDPSKACFDYTNINKPPAYHCKCSGSTCKGDPKYSCTGSAEGVNCSTNACETFQDCPGSIQVNGSYLVGLYSENNYCVTFNNPNKGIVNLDAYPLLKPGGEKISKMYVIPTK